MTHYKGADRLTEGLTCPDERPDVSIVTEEFVPIADNVAEMFRLCLPKGAIREARIKKIAQLFHTRSEGRREIEKYNIAINERLSANRKCCVPRLKNQEHKK